MVPVVRKFSSFAEADAADVEADMKMSPEQRLQMVMELRERYYGDAVHQRMDRVYQIVKRGEG